MARLFVVFYMVKSSANPNFNSHKVILQVVLHFWVVIVLFSRTPDSMK